MTQIQKLTKPSAGGHEETRTHSWIRVCNGAATLEAGLVVSHELTTLFSYELPTESLGIYSKELQT